PTTAVKQLQSSGFVVTARPGLTFYDFIINSNPKKPMDKELLDPRIRLAFAHAIDREALVRTVWQGHAQPATTIVPPGDGHWHNPGPKPESFDIGMANRLLDQAGYRRGPNGTRMAGGHPMSYTVLTPP